MRSLKQLWSDSVGDDIAGHFPFAYHRVVLGVLLALTLVVQTVLSVDAVQPDELIDQQLLSTESDANSVVAVQRESFNVALTIGDWLHGAATTRDVQVARALLGNRLNVITQSRALTASNVGPDYRAALAALDEVILSLGDSPEAHSIDVIDPVVQEFLTQARALTELFQQFGREQVQLVVEANRSRQRTQTVLQILTVLLVGLLSGSIVIALGRGYRSVVAELAAQQRQVTRARRDLDLVRDLDARIAPLLRAVDSGSPARAIRARLKDMLDGLATGHEWIVPLALDEERSLVAPGAAVDGSSTGADPAEVDPEPIDLELVAVRAQVVLDALRRREQAAVSVAVARLIDPLTGLHNRLGFLQELEGVLTDGRVRPVAVCFLDIDRFGEVNGTLGFTGADRVLVELAGRLRDSVRGRPGAVVARMAADEFAVAVPIDAREQATTVVDGLCAAGTYVSYAGGMEAAISVSVSVGETVGARGGIDAQELMRQAAVAMLLAKKSSERRGRVRYDPIAHDRLASSLTEEVAVRNAMRSGEFCMHYQPIVDLATGRPVGLEALARWDRPGVGLILPGEFLPIIQRSGFSIEFGFDVLVEVLTAWKRTLRAELVQVSGPTSYVSVNIDAVQLEDVGFEAFVLAALERTDTEPRELVLELTEHAAIGHTYAPMLDRLRTAGVRVAVDDFGSGFSSLGRSTQLPVDLLKLDRSFVTSLLASDHDPQLFSDMAGLARTLRMTLIAEGIETREVADLLFAAGIRVGQGFLFSPALPEDEAARWIRAHRPLDVGAEVPIAVGHDLGEDRVESGSSVVGPSGAGD
jgi:diguanylate cyclase (GGDEF)-like protein